MLMGRKVLRTRSLSKFDRVWKDGGKKFNVPVWLEGESIIALELACVDPSCSPEIDRVESETVPGVGLKVERVEGEPPFEIGSDEVWCMWSRA